MPLRLEELLRRLADAEVRYVLVGGLAVNAWGYLRATRDVDLVPETWKRWKRPSATTASDLSR